MSDGARGEQRPNEKRYEAHAFVRRLHDDKRTAIRKIGRSHGFALSSRMTRGPDGRNDVILTSNADDRRGLEKSLRAVAQALAAGGFEVYRIRLEEMMFDEVLGKVR